MGYYILCPYIISDFNKESLVVRCEDCRRRFESKKSKHNWIKKYCEKEWENCPYAKDLNRIYERMGSMAGLEVELLKNKVKKMEKEYQQLNGQYGKLKKEKEKIERGHQAAYNILIEKHKQVKKLQAEAQLHEGLSAFLTEKTKTSFIDLLEAQEFISKNTIRWRTSAIGPDTKQIKLFCEIVEK